MSWIQRYKLRNFIRNSIWILPVCGMVAALVLVNCLHWIEERAGWQSRLDPAAALALFGTLAGALLTFIVFLSSSLLLVVQLASAQLSPRIIGVVFRDWVTRFALTLFAFTFTFTLAVASKGLSPAINDPTAAVLAIDQIHHLLRSVGGRHLDEELAHDRSGSLRLVYRTPDHPPLAPLLTADHRSPITDHWLRIGRACYSLRGG